MKLKGSETGRKFAEKLRQKFPAEDEAHMAIFCPTLGFSGSTLAQSGFWTGGT